MTSPIEYEEHPAGIVALALARAWRLGTAYPGRVVPGYQGWGWWIRPPEGWEIAEGVEGRAVRLK